MWILRRIVGINISVVLYKFIQSLFEKMPLFQEISHFKAGADVYLTSGYAAASSNRLYAGNRQNASSKSISMLNVKHK